MNIYVRCDCGITHQIPLSMPGKFSMLQCSIPFSFKGCGRVIILRQLSNGHIVHGYQ